MAILTDDNYVDKAEKTIKNLVTDKRNFKNRNSDVNMRIECQAGKVTIR